ncbi:MCE family protein [Pseudonocardia sp. NPDC049635]|uniref:MCE family protein n=1 Tax=Pseudonocardia sp. NPDC049635 TaxID=3155506 RepID=UPI003410AFE6
MIRPLGRRTRISATVLVVSVLTGLTGCRFDGVGSLPLPGAVGTGPGSFRVEVELPDAGTLKPNAQVKIGDVPVGTVTALSVRNWHAVATVSLRDDVELPANAVAAVGQNSLLGATHLEMAAPPERSTTELLEEGGLVPLERTRAYPTTEQVLAATSTVLNGSGLNQMETTTRELQRALGGHDGAVGRLLPRLDEFVGGLDAQRDDIVRALDGLDRLSGTLAEQNQVLAGALDQLPPALEVLERERTDLTNALARLRDLGVTGRAVVSDTRQDLVGNLRNLEPVLRSLADADRSLVDVLGLALTFPFPAATAPNACRGDYCNLNLTLDLRLEKLDTGLLSGTPVAGLPSVTGELLGGVADGAAGDAADPLREVLPGTQPGDPAPEPAPAAPASPEPAPDPERDGGFLGGLLGGGS